MTNTTSSEINSRGFGRRQFLAGTAGGAALSLAGCLARTSLASTQTFGTPHELTQMNGRERHLVFGDADDPNVAFMLRQDVLLTATHDSRSEWIPFHVVVHNRKGLRTDRLALRLRAPPVDGSNFDANVYLRSPAAESSPSFTLSRTSDDWTVLDSGDIGKPPAGRSEVPGEANVHLYFVVNPLSSHPAAELYVEFHAELSEPKFVGRHSRTATGRMTFAFVRG